jgi:diaminopimelate decarboxylase
MDFFAYRDGQLYCEEVPMASVAEAVGTPCYVYSARTVSEHYLRLQEAFAEVEPLICYSVKANSNLALLQLLAERGSGFDVISGGELFRVLQAGADPGKVVFAGPGKTQAEIREALRAGVLMLNVESAMELETVAEVARREGRRGAVALRLNPDVDPATHTYITTGKRGTKFGFDLEAARAALPLLRRHEDALELIGLHMHIGSQITEVEPYVTALGRLLEFRRSCLEAGFAVPYVDMGGGFGVNYRGGEARLAAEFAQALVPLLRGAGCRLVMEPGRFIVGNAGVLLVRVLYVKQAGPVHYCITDGAMNDLIRPALYGAFHRIWPLRSESGPREGGADLVATDVVGPVCESGDFFARGRPLPPVGPGEVLVVFSAGAYGMSMSSNYNSRPRAAEVLVEGECYRLCRRRETLADLVAPEREALGSPATRKKGEG